MKQEEPERLKNDYTISAERYGISQHLVKPIVKKIVFGNSAGDFIESIFSNNLTGTFRSAQPEELEQIPKILTFLHHEAPARSREKNWKGFRSY